MSETNNTAEAKTTETTQKKEGVLKAAGKAAIKRHGLKQVWVAADGQVFSLETDAKAYAKNLASKDIIKVTQK